MTASERGREGAPHGRAHEERALVTAAQAGDRRALEELVRQNESSVYRFGRHMCRDEHDAEEVLQETFLAMTRSLKDFRGQASLSTWLYSVARSFCIKKRRRSKYAPAHVESLDASSEEGGAVVQDLERAPDEAVAAAQLRKVLEGAISGLRPMYREVLVLRDIEGLTAPEVSEALSISVQAVKSRLHRAREQVRAEVGPLVEGVALPAPSSPRCHQTAKLFSQHLEGEIDAGTCAEMERHVESCPHCGAVCHTLRETLAACSRVGAEAPEVPPELQRAVRAAVRAYIK